MKFVDSKYIDLKKWDKVISSSKKNNVFCYSWYLNATCKNWGAIMEDDYSFIMPLPYKKRLFLRNYFQHPFSRNLEFFGEEKKLIQATKIIESAFKFRFHFNSNLSLKNKIKRYQDLLLTEEIIYKKNAIRILQKNKDKYCFYFMLNY